MVRNIAPALAQIGRLATPAPEALGLGSQDKSRNFFREVSLYCQLFEKPPTVALDAIEHSFNRLRLRGDCLQICRILPWVIYNYKLDELITLPGLRRNVGMLIRKNAHVQDPRVRPDCCKRCCLLQQPA